MNNFQVFISGHNNTNSDNEKKANILNNFENLIIISLMKSNRNSRVMVEFGKNLECDQGVVNAFLVLYLKIDQLVVQLLLKGGQHLEIPIFEVSTEKNSYYLQFF